jgi:ATP-dependent protease ClpP protease subunit
MLYDAANEYPLDQAKRSWASRHRWTRAAGETWATLDGEINQRSVNKVIATLDPNSPLILTIESTGGNPLEGFRLFHALRAHAPPVTTMTRGHCDSAALIPFLGGDIRIAGSGATFLLHNVECDPTGRPTAAALRSQAISIAEVDAAILNVICARSRRFPGWQVTAEMDAETRLDGAQAQLRGLATHLVSG